MKFKICPRCGEEAFEKLHTYSHCVNCLHFEDYDDNFEHDYFAVEKMMRELEAEDEPMDAADEFLAECPQKKKSA